MVEGMRRSIAGTVLCAAAGLALTGAWAQDPQGTVVNGQAMRHADAPAQVGDWLSYSRTWDEQRFSPLTQINDGNVQTLGLAWYADLETYRGVQASPLVIDGVLYNESIFNVVTAYDGKTGRKLWTYDPKVGSEWARLACCGPSSRGIAAWNGKLYIGALDGRLIAIDAKDGRELWSAQTFDGSGPLGAYSITGAPRVYDGKVVIGNGGADYGVRGFVVAYDAETGKRLWKFYTVPGNPADGPDGEASDSAMKIVLPTWHGEWWKYGGGGTAWDSFAYDPDLNLVYIGTGNGSPHMWHFRSDGKGDNLFLCSIVAVDADTGEYKWHYQMVPEEEWDYTCTQPIMLADMQIAGQQRKVLMQAPKNGFFYVLDRVTGELISAEKFTPVNLWATHIDLKTGRPAITREARYGTEPVLLTPSVAGAHNWNPMAYNPMTGLVYFPAQEHWWPFSIDPDYKTPDGPAQRTSTGTGGPMTPKRMELMKLAESREKGWLTAWDPVNQKEVWRVPHERAGNGGVLTTAGNLVFEGTAARTFAAFKADTGEKLWEMPVQTVPMAGPITYMLDGEQYVAVNAGWGGGMAMAELRGGRGMQRSDARVLVFKLGAKGELPPLPDRPPIPLPPPSTASKEVIEKGGNLYARTCANCHGPQAVSGGVIRDLRHMTAQTHAMFNDIVLKGTMSGLGMASFANVLSESDAEAIHAYVIARANDDWNR